MAILLMFYGIIIPKDKLQEILSGDALKKVLTERNKDGKAWFDDFLYKEGSMSPLDNEQIIKFWESKGLVPIEVMDGKQFWKDLCLVQFPDSEPTLSCDWIEIFYGDNGVSFKDVGAISPDNNNVYVNLKGSPRNILVKEARKLEEWEFTGNGYPMPIKKLMFLESKLQLLKALKKRMQQNKEEKITAPQNDQ